MIVAASVGEDLFRGLLQGTPPGTVYALVALGFVLAYKTSGVFNLAFGAQAYVSAAMYFQARVEWGWAIVPALVVSVASASSVVNSWVRPVKCRTATGSCRGTTSPLRRRSVAPPSGTSADAGAAAR